MQLSPLLIKQFQKCDVESLVYLWKICKLTFPLNNPKMDIARKIKVQPELILVGYLHEELVASVMAGYDGHRGWINYLAVHPNFQAKGFGKQMMDKAEELLCKLGCHKINLQIREGNEKVVKFYQKLGYVEEKRINMGKRLKYDQ